MVRYIMARAATVSSPPRCRVTMIHRTRVRSAAHHRFLRSKPTQARPTCEVHVLPLSIFYPYRGNPRVPYMSRTRRRGAMAAVMLRPLPPFAHLRIRTPLLPPLPPPPSPSPSSLSLPPPLPLPPSPMSPLRCKSHSPSPPLSTLPARILRPLAEQGAESSVMWLRREDRRRHALLPPGHPGCRGSVAWGPSSGRTPKISAVG